MSNQATVKKEPLTKVSAGDKYRVNNKNDEKMKPLPAKMIVRNAEAQVGKELPYDLITYNCEHFVTELRYGVPECDQVCPHPMSPYSVVHKPGIGRP